MMYKKSCPSWAAFLVWKMRELQLIFLFELANVMRNELAGGAARAARMVHIPAIAFNAQLLWLHLNAFLTEKMVDDS